MTCTEKDRQRCSNENTEDGSWWILKDTCLDLDRCHTKGHKGYGSTERRTRPKNLENENAKLRTNWEKAK